MIFTRRLGAVTLKPRTKTKDDNEYIKDARMELSKGTDVEKQFTAINVAEINPMHTTVLYQWQES